MSLSTTTIGPAHLGQRQRSLESWTADESGSVCGAEASNLKTKRQESGTLPVGQEAEMPDAHEAVRKQVQQEATQEFIERESQQSLFVVVGGVTPAKGDFLVGEGDQSVIGDGYAMGVTGQIAKHVLGSSERSFNGIQVTRELAKSSPPVVICSVGTDPEVVEAARQAGALAYVFKVRVEKDLMLAVKSALHSKSFVSPGPE